MWINLWITQVVSVDNLWITLVQQLRFYPQDTHRISPTCGQPVDNSRGCGKPVDNLGRGRGQAHQDYSCSYLSTK